MDKALKRAQQKIVEFAIEFHGIRQQFTLAHMNSASLIIWDRQLFFYNADAIIRLLGVKEPVADWINAYEKAAEFASKINIETLSKLLLQTKDDAGIRGLMLLRMDRDATKNEILKRMKEIPIIRSFLQFIDSETQKDADNLAAHAKNLYNKWAREKRKQKGAYYSGLYRPPQQEVYESLPVAPLKRVEETDERTGIKPEPIEYQYSHKDTDQDVITYHFALYRQLQQEVDQNWLDYRPSPLAKSHPFPLWDKVAPEIWKVDVDETLQYLQPCLKELNRDEWMKSPYRSLGGSYIKSVLEESKTSRLYLDKTDDAAGEMDIRTDIAPADSYEDESLCLAMLETKLKKYLTSMNVRKPDKIILTFQLVLNGHNLIQAAKQAGISYATAKKYFKNFINIFNLL